MWWSDQGGSCWPTDLVRPFLATSFTPFPSVAQEGATLLIYFSAWCFSLSPSHPEVLNLGLPLSTCVVLFHGCVV